jgi:hypothetical protein
MKKPKYFGENEFRLALEEIAALLNGAELVLPLENKNASYVNQDVGQVDVDLLVDANYSMQLALNSSIKIDGMRVRSVLVSGDKNTILKWITENANAENLRSLLMEKYRNIYMNLDRQQFDRD